MLEYDYSDISRQPGVLPFVATLDPGPWRYAPLLPVHGASEAYAYDVGQTVTLPCGVLGAEAEVDLFLKSDATNPSRRAADRG